MEEPGPCLSSLVNEMPSLREHLYSPVRSLIHVVSLARPRLHFPGHSRTQEETLSYPYVPSHTGSWEISLLLKALCNE